MEKFEYKDMFGIYLRIKEISKTYQLFLNRKTNKIELFDYSNNQICLTFDFPLLPNVIDKIKQTRRENAIKLFRQIEEKNRKIEEENIKNTIYYTKNCEKML